MNGVGIGIGLVGCTTIIAVVYMMERGYKWWQIAIVILISMCITPHWKHMEVDE